MRMPEPIIRLELEHMKHTLVRAMGVHFAEIDENVRKAIEHAVDNFDYGGEIEKIVNNEMSAALKEALHQHFQVGGPGYETIQEVAVGIIQSRLSAYER